MFYVIDRSTLRKWFVGILLAGVVFWLFWQILIKTPVFRSGHERMVLWRQVQSGLDRFKPSRARSLSMEIDAHGSETDEADTVPESVFEDHHMLESLGWESEEQVISWDDVDEYLPALPLYSEDLQLAIPTSGQLLVAVQPLTKGETFAEFRWERERSRSRQLETMQGIMVDGSSSEEQKASAQARVMDLMASSELESELEGLLMAQGLPDAVVVLGSAGTTVMVDTVLTEEEAARIGDTISDMIGVPLEQIKILDQRS
ncbi:MAG: SpoIIIAH-like family protein [Firmicutes bacterium]|nr:SpoIIIAH-like family protein [Bacillota bacterium]